MNKFKKLLNFETVFLLPLLFKKIINTTKGRLIWLALIFAFTFLTKDSLLGWLVSISMAWFAITYLQESYISKYKKIWKLAAILSPFLVYLIYILNLENQILKKTRDVNIADSLKIKTIKLLLIFISLVFIAMFSLLSYSRTIQSDISTSYIARYNKSLSSEIETEGLSKKITEGKNKNIKSYESGLNTLTEQLNLFEGSLNTAKLLKYNLIFSKYIFPEINKSLDIQIPQLERYVKKAEINIQWYQEMLREQSDSNKLSSLLQISDEENIRILLSSTNVENESKMNYKFSDLIRNNTYRLTILTLISLLGILIFMGDIIMFARGIKMKILYSSLGWLTLGVVNVLCLLFALIVIFE